MPRVTPLWRYFSSQKHFFIMPDLMLNWTLSKCQSPVYWQVHPRVPVHLLSCIQLQSKSDVFKSGRKIQKIKFDQLVFLFKWRALGTEYSHLLQSCQFCGIVQARQSNLSSPREVAQSGWYWWYLEAQIPRQEGTQSPRLTHVPASAAFNLSAAGSNPIFRTATNVTFQL